MSSDPSIIASFGYDYGVWFRNATLSTSGSTGDIWGDRVQSAEPTATHDTAKYYELGRKDATGATTAPTQTRFVVEENLHNSEIDMYLAGVNPSTGSGFNAANVLGQNNSAYIVQRNEAGSVIGEIGLGNLRVSEIQYRFVNNGPCTVQYTLEGTSGSYYTTAGTFEHPLWGTQDNTSPGGIHGKDARICFGGNGASYKAYRLQSFTIRAAYPVQHVTELGRRQEVGVLNDVPDVTVDFDLLQADYQPHDVFFGTSNDGGVTKYNLTDPKAVDVFINVYDPDLPEASSVVKSFRIDNCKPSSNTPTQARVRQLATARWSLVSVSSDTVNTGGLTISKTEITS